MIVQGAHHSIHIFNYCQNPADPVRDSAIIIYVGEDAAMFDKVAPAVRKETKRVAVITIIGVVLMIAGFAAAHRIWPESVSFDYTVILAGICGGAVAIGNFFLMGLTVQNVAATEDEESARKKMRTSYTYRNGMMLLWAAAAIIAPCFQFVAGILPLMFPSAGLKLLAVFGRIE